MKSIVLSASIAALVVCAAVSTRAQTLPGAPETNGIIPKTSTAYVNGTNTVNNLNTESLSIDIANNGNLIVGWEDDGSGLQDIESIWTLLDPNGIPITPPTVVSNRSILGADSTFEVTTTTFLSYWRSDNTSAPGYMGWGPRVKANRFGNGIGMGAMPWEIGLEIPELFDINEDAGGPPPASDDFPAIQLMNNDGTPLRLGAINGITNLGIVTLADADVQPSGAIRLGGWDYLSSGNILIVGESRQNDDWVLTGQASGRTPVYRIVTPGGLQVKGYSAVSATPDAGNISRNGVAVATNGFAIRWQGAGGTTYVRLFDNTGTPTTTNLSIADITGHPEAAGGGDGSDHGISGNGKDTYVLSCDYNNGGTNGIWVTVLNTDGTVRWSKDVADDLLLTTVSGSSAAVDGNGQVIVVFCARADLLLEPGILGRRFDASGNPVGGTFYVSETEVPDPLAPPLPSSHPKVAWRNGKIAVAWLSHNYPDITLTGSDVIAYRLFVSSRLPGAPENNGLTPKTSTLYVNGTNGVNNLSTEALGVGIANNGNVMVAWEDDGSDISDIEAVWTMFDSDGHSITPPTRIISNIGGVSVTNNYLSFFRPDGTATPGYVAWGPKIHANLFGSGIGQGANGDADLFAGEVPSFAAWAGSGNFPVVQLFDNSGARQSELLTGVSQTYAADPASIRIGDWEYLANGNIVIVGDSRQNDDLVNLYGGTTPANHTIYRIVNPAGAAVKPEALVNDTPIGSSIWHGVGVTKDGFAVRFSDSVRGTCVRLFDNNGAPITSNLPLATLTGYAQAGGGGRGDSVGFHGNGKDAYVHACDYNVGGFGGFWVTVLNTNGTVRWTRDVSDDLALVAGKIGRGDAAIDESGAVIVVYSAQIAGYADPNINVTLGRRFDPTGNPLGGTFYLSEKETPSLTTPPGPAQNARVAWRNGQAAIIWESANYPDAVIAPVIAQRYFLTGPPSLPSLAITHVGGTVKISWPEGVTGFTLESSSQITGGTWTAVSGVVNNSVTVPSSTGNQFYRLRR